MYPLASFKEKLLSPEVISSYVFLMSESVIRENVNFYVVLGGGFFLFGTMSACPNRPEIFIPALTHTFAARRTVS